MAHIHERIDFTVTLVVVHQGKVGMIYWARPKDGALTHSAHEHHDIRWCTAADLEQLRPSVSPAIKWYCAKAFEELGGW